MKRWDFSYKVKVEIELTPADIDLIFECASVHYDLRVRSAASPRPPESRIGGEFWPWFVLSCDNPVFSKDGKRRNVRVTEDVEVLSLASKALEMPINTFDDTKTSACGVLRGEIYEMLMAIRDEHNRLNGKKK